MIEHDGSEWLRFNNSRVSFHSCIMGSAETGYELLDTCIEECEAQEARILGGEIWEMYAETVVQQVGRKGKFVLDEPVATTKRRWLPLPWRRGG